jgi:hypothetical protein
MYSPNTKAYRLAMCRLKNKYQLHPLVKTSSTKKKLFFSPDETLLAYLVPFLFFLMATFLPASVTFKRWRIWWFFQRVYRQFICKNGNVVIVKDFTSCSSDGHQYEAKKDYYSRYSWGSNSNNSGILLVSINSRYLFFTY